MVKILQYKIRNVTVIIKRMTAIEVETTSPPRLGTPSDYKLAFICFGVNDPVIPHGFIPVYYDLIESGTVLAINTLRDPLDNRLPYTANSFKIYLPPDCSLRFTYI